MAKTSNELVEEMLAEQFDEEVEAAQDKLSGAVEDIKIQLDKLTEQFAAEK